MSESKLEQEMSTRVAEMTEDLMLIDPVRFPTKRAALDYIRRSLTGGDPVANTLKERDEA